MTAELPRWGPHLHGLENLEDLATVQHSAFDAISVRVAEAARDHSMMLITGPVGVGKSYATARAVERCTASGALEIAWIELAGTVRGRALAHELYPQITGSDVDGRPTMLTLRNDMSDALAERPRLLVCDEAQHVGQEAMQLLRWLYDRATSRFGLVFVGTTRLLDRLPPEIASRCVSHVKVTRIADDDAPGLLAAYHPLFATADPALLSNLNRTSARGEWRWWAKFLLRAHRYLPRLAAGLTRETAEIICTDLKGGAR